MSIRRTEPRHEALAAVERDEVSYTSGRISDGTFWRKLPGSICGEETHSARFNATMHDLTDAGLTAHAQPGIPRRSGPIQITESGREVLAAWNAKKKG